MKNIINNTGDELKDLLLESLGLYQNNDEEIKNKEFLQYRNETFLYRQQLMEINPTAFRILDLMSNLCEKNNTIIISCKDIAIMINKTERTCQRAIKDLKDYNFLTAIKYKKNNIYFLNPYVVCRVDGSARTHLATIYKGIKRKNGEEPTVDPQIELTDINKTEFNKRKNEETITYKIKKSGKVNKLEIDDALEMVERLLELVEEEKEKIRKQQWEDSPFEMSDEEFENYVNNEG